MILDKRNQEEMPLLKEIEFAFSILNYNQGLVQFADSKANALLLINSIFIASIGPFFESIRRGHSPAATILIGLFLLFSIGSILLSLSTIVTRKVPEIENANKGLIFYGHVIESRSPEGYAHEFAGCEGKRFRETLLTNIFVVSKIAATKYSVYSHAQNLTMVSCLFWIVSMLYLLLV